MKRLSTYPVFYAAKEMHCRWFYNFLLKKQRLNFTIIAALKKDIAANRLSNSFKLNMEAIISAIISGFFSLAGIWYQNYLNKKSNIENVNSTFLSEAVKGHEEGSFTQLQNKKSGPRIFFTILITLLPWLIWKFLIFRLTGIIYKHINTYAAIMVSYFLIWLVVTIIAILSGWNFKTFFEKLILIVSSSFLLYWIIWMIIVHHLL